MKWVSAKRALGLSLLFLVFIFVQEARSGIFRPLRDAYRFGMSLKDKRSLRVHFDRSIKDGDRFLRNSPAVRKWLKVRADLERFKGEAESDWREAFQMLAGEEDLTQQSRAKILVDMVDFLGVTNRRWGRSAAVSRERNEVLLEGIFYLKEQNWIDQDFALSLIRVWIRRTSMRGDDFAEGQLLDLFDRTLFENPSTAREYTSIYASIIENFGLSPRVATLVRRLEEEGFVRMYEWISLPNWFRPIGFRLSGSSKSELRVSMAQKYLVDVVSEVDGGPRLDAVENALEALLRLEASTPEAKAQKSNLIFIFGRNFEYVEERAGADAIVPTEGVGRVAEMIGALADTKEVAAAIEMIEAVPGSLRFESARNSIQLAIQVQEGITIQGLLEQYARLYEIQALYPTVMKGDQFEALRATTRTILRNRVAEVRLPETVGGIPLERISPDARPRLLDHFVKTLELSIQPPLFVEDLKRAVEARIWSD